MPEVIEAGTTSLGDVMAASMLEAKPEAQPREKLGKTEDKPTKEKAGKIESPLDAVVPKKEKKEEVDDNAWEKEEVLKDFPEDAQKRNWHGLRKVTGTLSLAEKRLNAEIASLKEGAKTDPVANAERESLIKERDELKGRLTSQEQDIKAINGRYSDEFRALEKERDNALQKVADRAKSYGANKDDFLEALSLPPGKFKTTQVKEVLAELDPDDRARVMALIENVETTQDKIADFEKDLPSKWEEISQRKDQQMREQQETKVKAIKADYEKFSQAIPAEVPTLREVDPKYQGATEWNSDIAGARDRAWELVNPAGKPDLQRTFASAFKGEHYDSMMKRYLALHTDFREIQERLAKFEEASPDFKGAGGKQAKKQMSAADKLEALWDKELPNGAQE